MGVNNRILVVGGAGYIGSHAVLDLKENGFSPIVIDNFSTGSREIAARLDVPIIEGEISDEALLSETFDKFKPIVVMHFAAFAYVGESVTDPERYYYNNVAATLSLLKQMRLHSVRNFIFSSTCATYGLVKADDITEEHQQAPINPYGRSKLMVEWIVKDYQQAYALNSVMLRYFNAAGAHQSGIIGERHDPETHLIPLTIQAALNGTSLTVFGDDYDTPDGTCIRDYVHVSDLASAHRLAAQSLIGGGQSAIYNIGTGSGASVLEVINAVELVSGRKVGRQIVTRRAGDPPRLVCGSTRLAKELGWKPKFTNVKEIVETAFNWHRSEVGR